MHDYSAGVEEEAQHSEYLQWLSNNRLGLVLNLTRGRTGAYTLHRASCGTLSYDLASKGQRRRCGKICFDNDAELEEWCTKNGQIVADFNRCSKC